MTFMPGHTTFELNAAEESGQDYDFVFVGQTGSNRHVLKTFAALAMSFTDYKS